MGTIGDRNLDGVIHVDRSDTLAVDQDLVRATTNLNAD
jgi:hypothetical protein